MRGAIFVEVILQKIEAKHNQNSIALTYATAIHCDFAYEEAGIDWKTINTAIINRWSKSGLERVKLKAWKLLDRH